ncbi:MAG: Rrf2 family transcriptional regulator [Betaproteobacteria bacterium]|nr:Rrf2 family transcriptional regulator [Betaproteobacteria bacterium]
MRLTTKGRFAVTAMMDLALHDQREEQPVSLASICERQDISLSYMEQLFSRLRRNGLVTSIRGPGGGYHLGRHMSRITVIDIIQAVDEHLDATLCNGNGDCQNNSRCMTHDLWSDLNKKMLDYLASVSLGDLVARHTSREGWVPAAQTPPRRARARVKTSSPSLVPA